MNVIISYIRVIHEDHQHVIECNELLNIKQLEDRRKEVIREHQSVDALFIYLYKN